MKKTFLFLTIIAFSSLVMAQNPFRLIDEKGEEFVDSIFYKLTEHDMGIRTDFISITNITDSTISILMQIHKLQLAEEADAGMCFGGNCLLDTIAPAANIVILQSYEEYTGFDLQYKYENYDRSIIKINLLNAIDSSIMQSFFVYYDDEEVGLSEIAATTKVFMSIVPNPVKTKTFITYSLSDNCKTPSIVVKNMLGKEICNVQINGNRSGKTNINMENLPNGLYFCSIVCEDQTIITKKIVVRH